MSAQKKMFLKNNKSIKIKLIYFLIFSRTNPKVSMPNFASSRLNLIFSEELNSETSPRINQYADQSITFVLQILLFPLDQTINVRLIGYENSLVAGCRRREGRGRRLR